MGSRGQGWQLGPVVTNLFLTTSCWLGVGAPSCVLRGCIRTRNTFARKGLAGSWVVA
ncbi:hypothetical protein PR003_g831 [Phytophthora rubi]|uniref:Uncharacterized protein n=1 Tax=Phytophthora rubi TaxID=129364 RepID=A0A6A3P6E3_9STRA|nr:hypothetical protein PR002_g672 [Phytophthora rubi]KAE9052284.1 hypothetical protein PR001_g658 [Phytophthora rubi]KAE9359281.1 hypothetical protein PR003_g831 [Phytophthora rubi]